jgi:hypothetical protein
MPQPQLAAADELHDFEMRAAGNRRGAPVRWFHDAAVEFHGHAGRIEFQRFEQLPDRLAVWNGPNLAVDGDLNLLVG